MSLSERMERVKPFWESLSQEQQVELMTFKVKAVKEHVRFCTRKAETESQGTATMQR